MSIEGPREPSELHRIEPIEGEHMDQGKQDQKKKKVRYRGRSWAEKEEDLPVQPEDRAPPPRKEKPTLYADRILRERAEEFFDHLVTLEDRLAQLIFFETDALYDATSLETIKGMIFNCQVGGVLFNRGDYRRQAYLIENYQSVSKIPLLIGNGFLHGLSFYYQEEPIPFDQLQSQSTRRFLELGKAVMVQNRRLGVQVQFDSSRRNEPTKIELSSDQRKAFRKGIRAAQGIVGRMRNGIETKIAAKGVRKESLGASAIQPEFAALHEGPEVVGLRTLDFMGETGEPWKLFSSAQDALLVKENVAHTLKQLVEGTKRANIREEEINRRVMKALLIKAMFYQAGSGKA